MINIKICCNLKRHYQVITKAKKIISLNKNFKIVNNNNFEYLFIFSGDGWLLNQIYKLSIAKQINKTKVIPINLGKLGFFMFNKFENLKLILNSIVKKNYHINLIPIRNVNLYLKQKNQQKFNWIKSYFINDILIYNMKKAINPNIFVNKISIRNKLLSGYVISTTLGSFALMHSYGGPIFFNNINALILKPIASINNSINNSTNNAIIFQNNEIIKFNFDVSNKLMRNIKNTQITIDGHKSYNNVKKFIINNKIKKVKLISLKKIDWNTYLKKMFIIN